LSHARAAAAIAAVVLAAGSARAARPGPAHVPLAGGSPAQQALMRRILAGMSPSLITRISLTPPPKSLGDWPRTPTYLNVTAEGGPKSAAEWQTWLFKGAFGDLSAKQGLPPEFRFDPLADPPPAGAAGAASLAARVRREVARTTGARIVSLHILRPDGLAVELVLGAGDPAAYMKHELPGLIAAVRGRTPALDGSYLALVGPHGAVVWNAFQSTRIGSGGTYARPDLAGCNPIVFPRPPGGSSPPCPA
jgi:hypothetical protein